MDNRQRNKPRGHGADHRRRAPFAIAAAAAGIAGALVSTAVQVILWIAFTDHFPAILWRDTRLTAALIMDHGILDSNDPPGWLALCVATLIHFGLSLAYGAAFCVLARRLAGWRALAAGAAGGAALYAINLHGFTLLFAWFAVARGWITLAAHLAFGMSAVAACITLDRWKNAR